MEVNKKLNISDLKEYLTDKKVSGYIWYINEKNPQIISNKIVKWNDTSEAKNQIQEAYLTDNNNTVSIRIVNSDGIEHCFINQLENFKSDKYKIGDEVEFPSHIKEIKTLSFKSIYKLTKSVSGEEFKTWQPVLQFFTGIILTSKS